MKCPECDNNLKRKCALGTRIANGILADEINEEYQCANDAKYSPKLKIEVTECKYFAEVQHV
jgi:hypothetical protein